MGAEVVRLEWETCSVCERLTLPDLTPPCNHSPSEWAEAAVRRVFSGAALLGVAAVAEGDKSREEPISTLHPLLKGR